MPFGLTNAPTDFQTFIHDVLRPFLDNFCTAYLDEILVYSSSLKEYRGHIRQIVQVLTGAGLHLKPEKYQFHQTEVKYLGLIITSDGIKMDPAKVSTVVDWEPPVNVTDVQCFVGCANFYR